MSFPATPMEKEQFFSDHRAIEVTIGEAGQVGSVLRCDSCNTPYPCSDRKQVELHEAIDPGLIDAFTAADYRRQTGRDFHHLDEYSKRAWRPSSARALATVIPLLLESEPMRDYLREQLRHG